MAAPEGPIEITHSPQPTERLIEAPLVAAPKIETPSKQEEIPPPPLKTTTVAVAPASLQLPKEALAPPPMGHNLATLNASQIADISNRLNQHYSVSTIDAIPDAPTAKLHSDSIDSLKSQVDAKVDQRTTGWRRIVNSVSEYIGTSYSKKTAALKDLSQSLDGIQKNLKGRTFVEKSDTVLEQQMTTPEHLGASETTEDSVVVTPRSSVSHDEQPLDERAVGPGSVHQVAQISDIITDAGTSLVIATDRGLGRVNAQWVLGRATNEAQLRTFADALLAKSKSSVALTEDEWSGLAKSYALLLRSDGLSDDEKSAITQDALEVLTRYLVSHKYAIATTEGSPVLKNEFHALYEALQDGHGGLIDEAIQFYNSDKIASDPNDPNANGALAKLDALAKEAAPIDLGDGDKKPWRQIVDNAGNDQALLGQMLSSLMQREKGDIQKLADNPSDNSQLLEKLSLAMAYVTQRTSATDKAAVQSFVTLNPNLESIYNAICDKDESERTPEEKKFAQVYELYKDTSTSEGNILPSSLRAHMSGDQENFSLSDMQRRLNAAKSEKYPTSPRNFTPAESSLVDLEARPQDVSLVVNQTEAASQADAIAKSFEQQMRARFGDIDFEEFFQAFEDGKVPTSFFEQFSDGGRALLTDYLYPYAVLNARAQRSDSDPNLKFFKNPASVNDILTLAGSDPKEQVSVLRNVIREMYRPLEEDGRLKGSPIGKNQVGMLQTLKTGLSSPVIISSDAGSGKTTMAAIAHRVFNIDAPYIIHVAPFADQVDEGTTKLTSFSQITSEGSEGKTQHYFVTAEDLKQMIEANGGKVPPELKNALFLLDEHDDEAYRMSDDSRLQDTLFENGARRQVNMSATANTESLQNDIDYLQYRLGKQLRGGQLAPETSLVRSSLRSKVSQRLELEQNIANEFGRGFVVDDANTDKPEEQFAHVLSTIQSKGNGGIGGGSYLIEMPDVRLDSSGTLLAQFESSISTAAPNSSPVLLFRDGDGALHARTYDSQNHEWVETDYAKFVSGYADLAQKPQVFCLYTQDSVGGDFSALSNVAHVVGQYVVYGEKVARSHQIYQNQRRIRRPDVGTIKTETNVVLGPKAKAQLEEKRNAAVDALSGYSGEGPLTKQVEGIANLRSLQKARESGEPGEFNKQLLLQMAKHENRTLAEKDEARRVSQQLILEKEKFLRSQLTEDVQSLLKAVGDDPGTQEFADQAAKWISDKLQSTQIAADTDVDKTRTQILDGLKSELLALTQETPEQAAKKTQEKSMATLLSAIVSQGKDIDTLADKVWAAKGGATTFQEAWDNYVKKVADQQQVPFSKEVSQEVRDKLRIEVLFSKTASQEVRDKLQRDTDKRMDEFGRNEGKMKEYEDNTLAPNMFKRWIVGSLAFGSAERTKFATHASAAERSAQITLKEFNKQEQASGDLKTALARPAGAANPDLRNEVKYFENLHAQYQPVTKT